MLFLMRKSFQKLESFPFKYTLVYIPKLRASCCKPYPLQSVTGCLQWIGNTIYYNTA